jgi:hypothetical protein
MTLTRDRTELAGQGRQQLVFTLGRSIFDDEVLALDVAVISRPCLNATSFSSPRRLVNDRTPIRHTFPVDCASAERRDEEAGQSPDARAATDPVTGGPSRYPTPSSSRLSAAMSSSLTSRTLAASRRR